MSEYLTDDNGYYITSFGSGSSERSPPATLTSSSEFKGPGGFASGRQLEVPKYYKINFIGSPSREVVASESPLSEERVSDVVETTTSGNNDVKTAYEVDENGFSIIKLVYKTSRCIIPPKLIKLATSGELNEKTIANIEYTDLLRLATHPSAAEPILRLTGLRGVPLSNHDREGTAIRVAPHQVDILRWMKLRESLDPSTTYGIRGGIVRAEQGLGKTLSTLIHVLSNPRGTYPTLVLCSKTVMIGWKGEINKFLGTRVRVLYLHENHIGKREFPEVTREDVLRHDIVISSYDVCVQACKKNPTILEGCIERGDEHTLMKDKIVAIHERRLDQADLPDLKGGGVIYGTPWERVVCDESQGFAVPTTARFKAMMAIYGRYKWCLTGTPIRNYDTDIWSQLRFCGYTGVLQTNKWKKRANAIFKEHSLRTAIMSMNYVDANITLPVKHKHYIPLKLEGKNKEVYDFVLGVTRDAYDKMMNDLCSFACILALFTRLRQCAIAPYLLTAESKREKYKGKAAKGDKEALNIINKHMQTSSLGKWCYNTNSEAGIYAPKINEIINQIQDLPSGDKMLIFSSYTSCLDLIVLAFEKRLPELHYVQVDGDTKGEERELYFRSFDTDPDITVCLITYKVGGEGLNLAVANHVIAVEPWWTPAVHDQAESRCHRRGQNKEVHVRDIIIEGSIEEKISEIKEKKNQLSASFLEGTNKKVSKVGLNKLTMGRILGVYR